MVCVGLVITFIPEQEKKLAISIRSVMTKNCSKNKTYTDEKVFSAFLGVVIFGFLAR